MVVYGRKGYALDCRPPRRDMDRVMNVVNKIMHSHSLNISATMMRTGNGHWTWRGMGSKNGPLWKWIVCGWPKASSTIIKANWDDLTISQCFIYSRVQICYFAQSLLFSPCPCPVVVVAFGRSKWTLSYRSAMTDSRDTDGWAELNRTGPGHGPRGWDELMDAHWCCCYCCSSLSLCRPLVSMNGIHKY